MSILKRIAAVLAFLFFFQSALAATASNIADDSQITSRTYRIIRYYQKQFEVFR